MRPSRVLALGPVPDERLGALEQAGLGGELPLVLGRQPRAARGRVGARLGERQAGHRPLGRHLADRDREASARRRPLDLDEVVQARRQRLPLLDVRRLAVDAGLAPAEDRASARPRRRPRRSPPAPRRPATTGAATRTVSRAGYAARAAAEHGRRRPASTAASPSGGSASVIVRPSSDTSPSNASSRRFASAQSSSSPSLPARADDLHVRRCARRAASTRRASAARRSRRCTREHRRAAVARSRSFQPTQAPKTFSQTSMPTPFSQALRSSSAWLRFQRRVWWSMCRCSNQRARITPGTGCPRTTAPRRGGGRRSARAGASTRPRTRRPAARRAAPACASFIVSRKTPSAPSSRTSCADRLRVADRLAARADVPRVVVDEDAHAALLQERRRARAMPGTSRYQSNWLRSSIPITGYACQSTIPS